MYQNIKNILGNRPNPKQDYPEYEFIASCLRVGLTTNDLEKMTYIEAQKVLYSFLDKSDSKIDNTRQATQADIDNLLGG